MQLTSKDGDDRLVDGSDLANLEVVRHPERPDEEGAEDGERPRRVGLLLLRRHGNHWQRRRHAGLGGRREEEGVADRERKERGDARSTSWPLPGRLLRPGWNATRDVGREGPRLE